MNDSDWFCPIHSKKNITVLFPGAHLCSGLCPEGSLPCCGYLRSTHPSVAQNSGVVQSIGNALSMSKVEEKSFEVSQKKFFK